MTNVIDWILDLFRDPVQAQAFVNDPDRRMQNAGVQNLSAAQVQAVAASVAPAAVIHGGGNPVHGLQQAVAETHGIAFAPQSEHVFAPQTQAFSNNDTLSHNDVLSNNDPHILSPEAGHDVQQGGVNLDFGDITFGDKRTPRSDGSVINTGNAGDIDNTNVHGDGNVVGDGNVGANTGDILAGEGSHRPGRRRRQHERQPRQLTRRPAAATSSPATRVRSSRPATSTPAAAMPPVATVARRRHPRRRWRRRRRRERRRRRPGGHRSDANHDDGHPRRRRHHGRHPRWRHLRQRRRQPPDDNSVAQPQHHA